MKPSLASSITKAASKQTYYTIRFLADRELVEDAYRAYAYFRWVDDVLDADDASPDVGRCDRETFVHRQQRLLERCLRGETPTVTDPHEAMLVELVRHDDPSDGGLDAYLRHMMLVMEFDVRRRGRLVTRSELDEYTRWLAIAVTEAMHYFIGHGAAAPRDQTRYLAASGAHILHMLRDTYDDLGAGYFNIPRETLEAHSIGPEDVQSGAYRDWVEGRVRSARSYLEAGTTYFARVESARHRLAGLAYMARFEWLVDAFERDDFALRRNYDERSSIGTYLRMGWRVFTQMVRHRRTGVAVGMVPSATGDRK